MKKLLGLSSKPTLHKALSRISISLCRQRSA